MLGDLAAAIKEFASDRLEKGGTGSAGTSATTSTESTASAAPDAAQQAAAAQRGAGYQARLAARQSERSASAEHDKGI